MLRRSGHHAWRESGYGFCVFNNCAIAARAARERARPRTRRGRGHRRPPRQRDRGDLLRRPERSHGLAPPGPELPGRDRRRRERGRGRGRGDEREREHPGGCRRSRATWMPSTGSSSRCSSSIARNSSSSPAASTRASSIRWPAWVSPRPASRAWPNGCSASQDEVCGRAARLCAGGRLQPRLCAALLAGLHRDDRRAGGPRRSVRGLHRRPADLP